MSRTTTIRDLLETLILTLVIFLGVRSVVDNFRVEGRSMEPTLHNEERLLINKAVYWRWDTGVFGVFTRGAEAAGLDSNPPRSYIFGAPGRGDVIVFSYPPDPSRDFIKRVIAVPGEVVEIRNGTVFIDGRPLEENYEADRPNYSLPPTPVPPGHYFVLGDNRNNSSDSHVWGMVPAENIKGRAWITYWPFRDVGLVRDSSSAAFSLGR